MPDNPWVTVYDEGWNSTSYLQMRNGRLYREIVNFKDEGAGLALCFVPGEGCGSGNQSE